MTIYLSPPEVGALEKQFVIRALDSKWVAPVGPDLDLFEAEVAELVDMPHAVAVSSGTAALHLALLGLGVGAGDTVLVQSFTFAATAFAVTYTGATPVFVDSERDTWNVDPELVEQAIIDLAKQGAKPKALITVDLYGRCADYESLVTICDHHGVLLIEDAAEALGAWTFINGQRRPAGSFGDAAIISFNGNKIITTSGGGMLVTKSKELADRARHLSTQARQSTSHYEHSEIGFNYRLSNLLAALGRAQLAGLPGKISRRQRINETYRTALGDLPGVSFDPAASGCNCWLTCITIDPQVSGGVTRIQVERALKEHDIESRPLWMPMHTQPVFRNTPSYVNGVSGDLFARGLCLPSGSSLTSDDLNRVVSGVRSCWESTR